MAKGTGLAAPTSGEAAGAGSRPSGIFPKGDLIKRNPMPLGNPTPRDYLKKTLSGACTAPAPGLCLPHGSAERRVTQTLHRGSKQALQTREALEPLEEHSAVNLLTQMETRQLRCCTKGHNAHPTHWPRSERGGRRAELMPGLGWVTPASSELVSTGTGPA